jgi:hypothetical protein
MFYQNSPLKTSVQPGALVAAGCMAPCVEVVCGSLRVLSFAPTPDPRQTNLICSNGFYCPDRFSYIRGRGTMRYFN